MKKIITWLLPCLLLFGNYCYGTSDLITGKIVMIGNEPFTKLVCQTDNGQYILTGDLVTELHQFQGFEIELIGEVNQRSPNFKIEFKVHEYHLLIYDQNGVLKYSWVGFIKTIRGNLYLETATNIHYQLKGKLIPELKKYTGLKLWITGQLSKKWLFGKSILKVDSYGVIRLNTQ